MVLLTWISHLIQVLTRLSPGLKKYWKLKKLDIREL